MVKQLWRGEIPLAKTFWVFGVAAWALFIIAAILIEYNRVPLAGSLGQIPAYLLLLAPYVYFPFIYVAIWRSADNYSGPADRAIMAKITIVLGVLVLMAYTYREYNNVARLNSVNLAETASLLNTGLPIMVDRMTRLNKVSAEQNQLTYHYQIMDTNLSATDPASM